LEYSEQEVALGRSRLRHAPRQFHLQESQRKIFIPMAFFNLRVSLSFQFGPASFMILY